MGNKPAAEQEAALKQLEDERARQEAEKQERRQKKPGEESAASVGQASEKPDSHYPVIGDAANAHSSNPSTAGGNREDDDQQPGRGDPGTATPDAKEPRQEDGTQQSVPEPRSHHDERADEDQTAGKPRRLFAYSDGWEAAMHSIQKMPPDEFNKMLDLLIKHRDSQVTTAGSAPA